MPQSGAARAGFRLWIHSDDPTPPMREVMRVRCGVLAPPRCCVPTARCMHAIQRTSSAPQAVARFSNARIVLGVHGAGLSNCVFSRVGTHLVEIGIGRVPVAICYAHLAAAMGLRYSLVDSSAKRTAEAAGTGTSVSPHVGFHSCRRVHVSLSALKTGLGRCGI